MHKRQLSAPYTEEEVRFAAFKGNGRAAPGIDGLPREFYTHYWEDLGPILHELVIAVQQGLTLPQVFNQGVVALLPKTEAIHPLSGQFRPITLLNVDYKVIAGVMTERIKLVIPHLIHNTNRVCPR